MQWQQEFDPSLADCSEYNCPAGVRRFKSYGEELTKEFPKFNRLVERRHSTDTASRALSTTPVLKKSAVVKTKFEPQNNLQ